MAMRYPAAAPFFSGSFPSRQLHDWQSCEGPVSDTSSPRHPRPLHPLGTAYNEAFHNQAHFLRAGFLRACLGAEGRVEGRVEGRGLGRPVPGSLPIPRSSPPFLAHAIILRSFPVARAVQRWLTCTLNASRAVLTTFDMFSMLLSARRVTGISLERQFFYTPPAAAAPKLASHSFQA